MNGLAQMDLKLAIIFQVKGKQMHPTSALYLKIIQIADRVKTLGVTFSEHMLWGHTACILKHGLHTWYSLSQPLSASIDNNTNYLPFIVSVSYSLLFSTMGYHYASKHL